MFAVFLLEIACCMVLELDLDFGFRFVFVCLSLILGLLVVLCCLVGVGIRCLVWFLWLSGLLVGGLGC